MSIILPLAMMILWVVILAQDLAVRRVSRVVLVALAGLALVGHTWPWWAVTVLALACPRRYVGYLTALALPVGVLTNQLAPALALSIGAWVWSLGGWGGADGIVLLALALRHNSPGLLVGSMAMLAGGAILMLVRRQSLQRVLVAVPTVLNWRSAIGDIPAESEMPVAAALAAAGLVMEVYGLWLIVFG